MHIVICDDEASYCDSLYRQILAWAKTREAEDKIAVSKFYSSEDLLDAWNNGMSMDLLFLDIQMPGELSGMDLAKAVYKRDEMISFVFVSNYDEYACEGYSVNAIRFLLKPVNQYDVSICMDIAWRKWQSSQERFVTINAGTRSVHVAVNTILYAESRSHMLCLTTSDHIGKYEIRSTLDDLEKILPRDWFVRCHKSYIVNLRYVRKYKSGLVQISSGYHIPIGRKYAAHFITKLQNYYQGESSSVDRD